MALLNACWYGSMFFTAWATGAAPLRGCGPAAALRAASLTFAFIYGASQLTKVPRGLAILACVPLVDRGLNLAAGGNAARARWLAGVVAAACLAAVVALVVGCALTLA